VVSCADRIDCFAEIRNGSVVQPLTQIKGVPDGLRYQKLGLLRVCLCLESHIRVEGIGAVAYTAKANLDIASTSRKNSRPRELLYRLSRLWAWLFLAVMILFFVVAVPVYNGGHVNFLTVRNSQNILVAITPVLLLGLGQTFVIITAGIDLSVGWVMSLASVLSALAIRASFNAGVPLFLAVVAGFLATVLGAGAVGFFNGAIIAKLKVPAFIVTLGSSFIVRGLSLEWSENTTVIGLPPGIRAYGNEALFYLIRGAGGGFYFLSPPELTGDILRRMDRILPYPVVMTAVVVAIAIFLLRRTQFGRHTYAIGGNVEAALRAGIPVDWRIIQIYTLSAVTAGIGGFISTLSYTAGSAVIGDPLLLSSIAAVIIGGVSLAGGAGTVVGTIIGSLIIAVLTTGLVMLNVDAFWQFIVVGAVVILAVLIDQSRHLIAGRIKPGS
jgi:ribose transport system permease protein